MKVYGRVGVWCVAVVLAMMTLAASAHATDYYVNDSSTTLDNWCTAVGNNGNDGLTASTPKATAPAILSAYDLGPGDNVYVDTGDYTGNVYIAPADGGSSSAPVSFIASPYGVTMSFDGPASNVWLCMADYVTITTATSTKYSNVAQRWMTMLGTASAAEMDGAGCGISRCYAAGTGGATATGFRMGGSGGVVENCIVKDAGYGIVCQGAGVIARNCTVYNCTQGIQLAGALSEIANNIVWADGAGSYGVYDFGTYVSGAACDYNDIYPTGGASAGRYNGVARATLADWQAATGKDANSMSADPLFAEATMSEFHLQSKGGRYDVWTDLPPEDLAGWILDSVTSPCLDAGNPASDYSQEQAPNGGRVNMGAYGNTEQASMTRGPEIFYVNDSSTDLDNWCTAVGDDINSGRTPATPKATVQEILASYDLEPGDTVRIDTGFYSTTETITIGADDGGSAGMPVVFAASPYGATIYHNGVMSACISITGSYVTLTTDRSTKYPSAPQYWMVVTNGGTGILATGTHCVVSRCDVYGNADYGILVTQGSTVENCISRQNAVGISCTDGGTTVMNCTIYANWMYGLWIQGSVAGGAIKNNIIYASDYLATAVCDFTGSGLTGAAMDYNDIYVSEWATALGQAGSDSYSDLAGWRSATGKDANSISADALFAAEGEGLDLHLKSKGGRYSPWTGLPPEIPAAWAFDNATSPCIDAGDPSSDCGGESAPNGGRINMGAYANTEQASKTRVQMTFYVNDSSTDYDNWCTAAGNDANDALTPATPKATIQAVLDSYDLEPGDVVRIDTGLYLPGTDAVVSAEDGGSSSAGVLFEASPYGVTIQSYAEGGGCFTINADYVTLTTAASTKYADAPQSWLSLTGASYGVVVSGAHCILSRCGACENGSNILDYGDYLTVENCIARGGNYGVEMYGFGGIVRNCTVYDNYYGAISMFGIFAVFENNIIWTCSSDGTAIYDAGTAFVGAASDYNDIYVTGGARLGYSPVCSPCATLDQWRAHTGTDAHSISVDPLFAYAETGDLHLKSQAGWYAAIDGLPPENPVAWYADEVSSPCIDAGNPSSDCSQEPTPNGSRVNMGAYGNTEQASKTSAPASCALEFSSPTYTVSERGATATITVTRDVPTASGVTVHYETSDGTATQPAKYATANGTLSWTASDITPKTFAVTIVDESAYEGDKTVNLTLSDPTGGAVLGTNSAAVLTITDDDIQITTTSLPCVQVGSGYMQSLAATGGTGPYSWSLVSGSLPSRLSLTSAGTISGTPTATGSTNFTVACADSQSPSATATKAFSIRVVADLVITTTGLPNGQAGVAYSYTLRASGGATPYTWSIASGSLPAGLSLTAGGVVSGTPTAAGPASFTVQVADSQFPSDTAQRALTFTMAVSGPTYQFAASDTETSTTNTNYVGKVNVTFTPPAADDWIIFAFCEFKCASVNYATYVQLFVDGAGEGQNTRKPVDPTDYMPFITVKLKNLSAASHNLQLMYRTSNSSAAAYIRNARICAVRKAALEVWNVAQDTGVPLTTTLADMITLNWTPVLTGNYLVISTAEINATTAVSTKLQTICNGAVNDEGIIRAADNGDFTTFMSFNYLTNAPAGVAITHKIAGMKVSADPANHYIRRARILALRLSNGRFNNTAAGYGVEQSTTQTTFQQALSTTWTYGVSGKWLLLNSARLSNTSTSYQTEIRVQLNDLSTCGQQLMKPKDVTDLLNYSSMDVRNLTTPRKVDMDWRTTNAAGTAKVKRLRFYGVPLDTP